MHPTVVPAELKQNTMRCWIQVKLRISSLVPYVIIMIHRCEIMAEI